MSYKDLTRVAPYNDDFNAEVNFLRILSVPGRPIQARELTQAQTILQNQIAQVSNHLFRNGTPVLGAKININQNKPACRFHNRVVASRATGTLSAVPLAGSNPGALYDLSDFIGRTFNNVDPLGQNTNGVATKTLTVTHAALSDDESELILYFTFGGSPVATDNLYFDASGSGGTALKASGDMFFGMSASCEPGVIYRDGHFVSVLSQEIIVAPGQPSTGEFAIGFRFDERIITEADSYFGSRLNDNAQGYYNQAAPGAHRYQVMPVLDFYDKEYEPATDEANDDFNAFLARFSTLIEISGGAITLDQTDTQYAKLIDLLARRTYDESGNYSIKDFSLNVKDGANSGELYYTLGPGKAYVRGYEIEKLASTQIAVNKARDYIALNNTYALGSEHPYFIIENSAIDLLGVEIGSPMIYRGINLLPGTLLYAYDQGINRSTGASIDGATVTKIGSCRVHSLVKYGSQWRLYIMAASADLINGAGSVKSLRTASTAGTADACVIVSSYEQSQGGTIAGTAKYNGNFRDPLVYPVNSATILKNITASETSYLHVVKKEGTSTGAGQIVFTADNNNQEFFSDAEDGLVLLTQLNGGVYEQPTVSVTINNAVAPATATITGVGNSLPITAYFKVLETEGAPRTKVLTNSTITVTINNPSDSASIASLLQEDVYRIVSIVQKTNIRSDYSQPNYALTAAEISSLTFDNGQRDFYYDVGSLRGFNRLNTYQNKGSVSPLVAAPTQFEITFEYFTHTAGEHGFFCINSYPFSESDYGNIPSFKSANGKKYNLINCIDFRSKLSEIAGRTMLQPSTRFRCDADTFTARNDRVVLTASGEFKVIEGIPALTPEYPTEPSNAMTLFTVALNPYTFTNKDLKVKKIDNRRYTMRDIGELDKRLSNLEEMTALSLLELRANDLEVIDSVTGFNKFKNGIFADPFRGHQYGDTDDITYRCASEVYFGGGITCPAVSFGLELNVVSDPTPSFPNLITLPPVGEEVFIKNEYASGSVNVNPYLFFTWNGTVELNPAVDTWIDVQQAPDIVNAAIGTTIIQQSGPIRDPMPTLSLPSMNFMYCGMTPEDQEAALLLYNAQAEAARAEYEQQIAAWQDRQSARQNSTTGGSSSTTITETVNDRVIATNIAPYMRSIPVAVHSRGMRQGAPLRAYLDNIEVDLIASSSDYITPTNDPAGANRPRVSSTGEFVGSFMVPAGTIPTGTKQFIIVDDEDTSSASTNYTSNGSIQIRQRTITSTRNTIIRTGGGNTIPPTIRPPRNNPGFNPATGVAPTPGAPFSESPWFDPIAQSFLIEEPNGVFLSSIDVFFKKKPTAGTIDDQPVTLYLVEMENGTPTNRMVPLSMVTKAASSIVAHATIPAQGANTFTFSDPIYLEGLTEYAFVIFSNSREYEAWISTLGEQDIFNYYEDVGNGSGGFITPDPPDTNRSIGIDEPESIAEFLGDRFRSSGGFGLPVINPFDSPAYEQPTVQSGELTNGSFLPRVDPEIGFRGTNSGGRGIAEQPYLGSLFKSQNSTTWTADQLSDITFRIRRYRFSNSDTATATVLLRDRKYLPSQTITTATNGNRTAVINPLTGTSLYPFPDQVEGDSDVGNNGGKLKVAATILNIGELVLPNTSANYRQAFHTGTSGTGYKNIVNKRLTYLTEQKVLDENISAPSNQNNYTAEISLGTSNPLLTPVLDRQQMKLIVSRFLTSRHDLSTDDLDLIDSPDYEFGPAWDAGTYISKTINLINPSDDLRVLVDAKLPGDSVLQIYYRTAVINPSQFTTAASNQASEDLIGEVCRLIYRQTDGTVGNPNSASPSSTPSFTDPANPKVKCLVTNVELDTAPTFSTVYAKSINDQSKFKLGTTIGGTMDKAFLVPESVAVDIEAQNVLEIPEWDALTDFGLSTDGLVFDNPQYVIWANRLWKRNANFSEYTAGMAPAVGGSAWIDTPWAEVGTPFTSSGDVEWREMVLEEETNPAISTGTQFVEYKYVPVDIPEDFTSFSIKIEMYSKNEVDVPIVKNLRAIAVI